MRRDYYRLDPIADELVVYEPLQRDRFGEAMSWLSSPRGLRWVVAPLTSLAILVGAAVAHADDDAPFCPNNGTACFYKESVFPALVVPTMDKTTGEPGWIVFNCEMRIAAGNSPLFRIEPGSPLDKLCDTIGGDE